MKTRFWIAAALPLGLVACGGGEPADGAAADSTATVSAAPAPAMEPTTPPMDSGAAAAPAAPAAGMVAMNAVGGSGVTGQMQAMAHGGGNETMVSVTLMAPGATTHSGHIHEGTCEALGKVVVPLQDVTLANGQGMSSTTLQIPVATVMNGQHVVSYHEKSGAEPGKSVVCGAIPAQGATASM